MHSHYSFPFGFLFAALFILLSLPYLFSMLEVSSNLIVANSGKAAVSKVQMALNEKQQLLIGTWTHESAENSDAFLKKIGIGIFLRQIAKIQKPTFKLTYDEQTRVWHLYIESAFKNHDYPFKIDERFVQTTIDGRNFWLTTTLDGNGVQTDHQEVHESQPKNIPSVVKRWVDEDGKLIITEECDGVVSRRTWKHETAENADAYYKAVGIGLILRNVAKVQKPTVIVKLEGDVYHVFIESAFKNHDWTFKLGQKFKLDTIDGRTFWATYTVDQDGKLVEVQEVHESQPKNVPSVVKRWIENGKLYTTEECGNVVAKRTFTRA
ncbi:hypothetical protein M3Y97_00347700 [Aphelenchoides bicaudatus]|nr:hypothetical protein M3Y97_00347700 [Aphelenchoides bicaudatus]